MDGWMDGWMDGRMDGCDMLCEWQCLSLLTLCGFRMLAAEPSQLQLDQLLAPHPVLRQWMSVVRAAVGPQVYDEAHEKVWLASARLRAAAAAASEADNKL
jgi:hypothetical protein